MERTTGKMFYRFVSRIEQLSFKGFINDFVRKGICHNRRDTISNINVYIVLRRTIAGVVGVKEHKYRIEKGQ